MTATVNPRELRDYPIAGATVIDVRSPAEFESTSIPGSVNVPLEHVEEIADALRARGDAVIVTCQTGRRATEARTRLAGAGVEDVRVLDGGLAEWRRAGNPVRRGRQRWAMERQVRLVAGCLVFAGAIVSRRHPVGSLLAGGVGAGLAVAALTDSCLMARLLGRLPYNNPVPFDLASAIAAVRR